MILLMIRSTLRLIWFGMLAALRNPALRLIGGVGALGAGVYAWNQGNVAPSTAVVLAAWLGRLYGTIACLWFAYAALRDQNEQIGAALRSKPVDGARWVFVNWAAGLAVWWILLGLAFAAAAIGQLPAAGIWSLVSHAYGFLRAAAVLAAMGTVSFALSRMLRSPLGGVLTLFAWFCAMAGLQFIPGYLRPDYSQNRVFFLPAAALLLCLAALLVERLRRGELRRPWVPAVAALALLSLAIGGGAQTYRRAPRPEGDEREIWDRIARQHVVEGVRTPGFWLPDGHGGIVRTATYEGKILLVFLFAADDMTAAQTLPAMEAIRREYGKRGVQPIAVCLSADQGDGAALARTGGYSFPIGSDITTLSTSPPASAVAAAYNVQLLPMLIVTDRRRRARLLLSAEPFYSPDVLRRLVEERLREEPQ